MLTAFILALAQLADRRVLRILAKSLGATLLAFAVLGAAAWWGIDALLAHWGFDQRHIADAGPVRALLAAATVIAGGVLAWRIVALAVLQVFADEVVLAVEQRHYPAALAAGRRLGWREELARGATGAGRALLFNAIAVPFALLLAITGIGPALLFWAVNAVLLGRELMDMVWLRHRHSADAPPPLDRGERFALGGIVAALLIVPFANLLAPFIGAAMAAHLIHRKTRAPAQKA